MKQVIGIDPGRNTGFANCIDGKLTEVTSYKPFEAYNRVSSFISEVLFYCCKLSEEHRNKYDIYPSKIVVVVEDATKVKYKTDKAKAQGAGYVKAFTSIWKDIAESEESKELIEHGILEWRFVRPNKVYTKWSAEKFGDYTSYKGRTNEHGRDAGLLAFNHSK